VIVGDQCLLWAAVAGVSAVMAAYPTAFKAVQWLGAAYLAWLGFKMLLAKPGAAPILNIKPSHFISAGFHDHLAEPEGHRVLHGLLSRCSSTRPATRAWSLSA
jgi:leucine efflux protein